MAIFIPPGLRSQDASHHRWAPVLPDAGALDYAACRISRRHNVNLRMAYIVAELIANSIVAASERGR